MACYHPIIMYRSRAGRNPKTGKWPLVSNSSQGYSDLQVVVPCGKCIGCRLDKSREWSIRCVNEASQHDKNCFITLTYDDDHLPGDHSLHVEHFQKFMKRLRWHSDVPIRFLHCGEYGAKNGRPHYHAILFGYDFDDKYFFFRRRGHNVFRSPTLEKLWPFGICSVGEVTYDSCAYVARYTLKKIKDTKEYESEGLKPPYITMSRRPGIASDWLDKYGSEVKANNFVFFKGFKNKVPRYYRDKLALTDPVYYAKIKVTPARRYIALQDPQYSAKIDAYRLAVKERLKLKQVKRLVRYL